MVSILVVLDQSLRHNNNILSLLVDKSFNPCCLGSVSSTILAVSVFQVVLLVSILVVLDQSLRLWVLEEVFPLEVGFNPCCLGSVSSTEELPGHQRLNDLSFNPCCLGSVSSTAQFQEQMV